MNERMLRLDLAHDLSLAVAGFIFLTGLYFLTLFYLHVSMNMPGDVALLLRVYITFVQSITFSPLVATQITHD